MVTSRSCPIVDAGLAGITAGTLPQTQGWRVWLLDKGRAPGGRMATRRIGEAALTMGRSS